MYTQFLEPTNCYDNYESKQCERNRKKYVTHLWLTVLCEFGCDFAFFAVLWKRIILSLAFAVIGKNSFASHFKSCKTPTTLISNFLTKLNDTQGSFRVYFKYSQTIWTLYYFKNLRELHREELHAVAKLHYDINFAHF
jgi:hypothetical protein